MRKILFRCKRKDNGEWIYWDMLGRITTHTGKISRATIKSKYGENYYYFAHQLWDKLDRHTIGQYTGLADKNGKRIFEGDIVVDPDIRGCVRTVEYHGNRFVFVSTLRHFFDVFYPEEWEVIGNIHDNHELLKVLQTIYPEQVAKELFERLQGEDGDDHE